MKESTLRKDVVRIFLLGLTSLFLIPAVTFWFVRYAEPSLDASYLAGIGQSIDRDAKMSSEVRQGAKSFYRAHPPSSACDSDETNMAPYRNAVCAPYSELWQFHLVRQISFWAIIGGVIVLLAVLALGAISFMNRHSQYISFLIGWNLLILVSAAEVILQGGMLVWLSFWLTAFFGHFYSIKIIAVIGVCAGVAVFYAVVCIFKRPPRNTELAGELIGAEDAPQLWSHIRTFAARLETAPPDQIIAGIDANFFVTEAPLTVAGKALSGRSLFVSLPLLRILDRSEADAVLSHEPSHFRGGDTASSAALGPKLVQYDFYCHMMRAGGLTISAFWLLNLYRVIFEFSLKRDSRAREFLADQTAADLVSAPAIVRSLIKIAAYARYRGETEQKLLDQNRRHEDSIGIAEQVANGLVPYASSVHFVEAMSVASIPHPFDSHPGMPERMRNVEHVIEANAYGQIVVQSPTETWISDIWSAADIERRLWSVYERGFAAIHEQSLAYRYEPANESELAIVLKYFPPVVVKLKGEKRFQVLYTGMILPGQDSTLSWDSVSNLNYEKGIGGDVLEIAHPDMGWFGAKTTKVKLPGIGSDREAFKSLLGRYWQRHQIMRQRKLSG